MTAAPLFSPFFLACIAASVAVSGAASYWQPPPAQQLQSNTMYPSYYPPSYYPPASPSPPPPDTPAPTTAWDAILQVPELTRSVALLSDLGLDVTLRHPFTGTLLLPSNMVSNTRLATPG
jgi:hypothetical protein